MTNLPATLSSLNRQIGELTEKLAPVTEDHVAKSVRTMLAAGLALPSGMQAEKAPEIYAYALSGVPAHGVHKATAKIIRGEYDINRSFVPTPPEFAAMARAETRMVREDLIRLREKAETLEDLSRKPEKRDEAMVARIRGLHTQFREEYASQRAVTTIPNEPISDEKAEYYQQIMAMRDAGMISAEQAAYRRKIAREIEVAGPPNSAKEAS